MEYRSKLAGLFREASQAVSANTHMASDLLTMASALDKMTDEKFASFTDAKALKGMFEGKMVVEGKGLPEGVSFENKNTEVQDNKSQWDKRAFSWNEKAASMVKSKLASAFKKAGDVGIDTGRPDAVSQAKLTPEQTPDGSHNQGTLKGMPEETPAALTKEQTPDQKEVLTSDMVSKSEKGEKEAAAPAASTEPAPAPAPAPAATPAPAEAQASDGGYTFAGIEMQASEGLSSVADIDADLKGLF